MEEYSVNSANSRNLINGVGEFKDPRLCHAVVTSCSLSQEIAGSNNFYAEELSLNPANSVKSCKGKHVPSSKSYILWNTTVNPNSYIFSVWF